MVKDRTAIVGIGQTPFAKSLPGSETELALEAIMAALQDAAISPSEVDGLVKYSMETTSEVDVARNLGAGDITYFCEIGYGGGGGCATVGHAALGVATGRCSVAVAWRSRKRGSPESRPWTQADRTKSVAPGAVPRTADWYRPWGMLRPVDQIAVLARRYMYEYGATRDHLANVALAARSHANRNPNAIMYDRVMTRDDYFNARWISEPLCLFDNCLETDGALAVVIVSAERARDCRHPPAYIHSFGQGFHAQHQGMTNYHTTDPLMGPSWSCAKALWRDSDFGAADIDVAQIYDAFTPLIPLSLEGYGFCGRGEGASFTDDGNICWPDGALPVNTSGGGLSEAYVHGYNLIVEGVRQIRGTSTCQVGGAQTCLVTSGEGVPTSALLLRS
jgi:acetyl-CoA acetyltransferase